MAFERNKKCPICPFEGEGGGGLAYLHNVQIGTRFFSLKVSLIKMPSNIRRHPIKTLLIFNRMIITLATFC